MSSSLLKRLNENVGKVEKLQSTVKTLKEENVSLMRQQAIMEALQDSVANNLTVVRELKEQETRKRTNLFPHYRKLSKDGKWIPIETL